MSQPGETKGSEARARGAARWGGGCHGGSALEGSGAGRRAGELWLLAPDRAARVPRAWLRVGVSSRGAAPRMGMPLGVPSRIREPVGGGGAVAEVDMLC